MGDISNFQIENAIKKIGDEALSKNFVEVFPSNYMNKFINHAVIQDDQKIINKILIGIKQMKRTDRKITLYKIKLNLGACKELPKKEIDSPSDTARDFFYFVQAFGIKLKLRSFVNTWMVEDRIQDLDSTTCRIFQLYFYENLFNPDENSKIQNETKLKKTTVETLLNELFSHDDKENEIKMNEYADKLGVERSV